MADLYTDLKATALELLEFFGTSATWSSRVFTPLDASRPWDKSIVATAYDIKIVILPSDLRAEKTVSREVGKVQASISKAYVGPNGFVPAIEDMVFMPSGKTYVVRNVNVISPAEIDVLYEVTLRDF